MRTMSEMLETLTTWHQWNGADHRGRELDADGDHSRAAEYRNLRDQQAVDPIEVLSVTSELIQHLTAGRWDAITEARLRGAGWSQIGAALDEGVDDIRDDYIAMVSWCIEHRPQKVDLDRYRTAVRGTLPAGLLQ